MRFLPALAVAGVLYLTEAPTGISVPVWHAFTLFSGFILACFFSAASLGVLVLVLLCSLLLTKSVPLEVLLGGYGSPAVWLVLFAFFTSVGFRKTCFGQRVAYHFIAVMGHHPILLVYAISFCDFLIAPFLPNTNARGAGIIFPITKALAEALDSGPAASSRKKIGSYLFMASFQLNLIIGAVFLTAMSTNPLAVAMLQASFGIEISWLTWFVYASVPMLLVSVAVPWVIYGLNKPTMTAEEMKLAPRFAREQLKKMGPMAKREKVLLAIFLGMITLWTLGPALQIHAAVVALTGVVLMLYTKIIAYADLLEEKMAWDILLWLAPLLALTGFLAGHGVIHWLVTCIQAPFLGCAFIFVYAALVLLYFYIHYFLTSLFIHLQAFFLPFVTVLAALGGDLYVIGMVFALLTCVSPGTTHYGTGTAAIYYASGYVTQKEWWLKGAVVSVVEVFFIAGVGYLWMSLLRA